MPETEALLERFRAAGTQVLGVSVDSIYSHVNWGSSLGGASFPLLADFQPRGALAESLGLFLGDAGITDRATVIIDRAGKVQYANSAGPGGRRDIKELLAEAERINKAQGGGESLASGEALAAGATLYIKAGCPICARTLAAVDCLRLRDQLSIKDVSKDSAAMSALEGGGGKDQVPCLETGGSFQYEAGEIIARLADQAAPLP